MSTVADVVDNTDRHRLELRLDGHLAHLDYTDHDGVLTLVHTIVPTRSKAGASAASSSKRRWRRRSPANAAWSHSARSPSPGSTTTPTPRPRCTSDKDSPGCRFLAARSTEGGPSHRVAAKREDGSMPKYLLLIHEDESAFAAAGQASFDDVMPAHMAFATEMDELRAKRLGGEALQPRHRDVPARHPHRRGRRRRQPGAGPQGGARRLLPHRGRRRRARRRSASSARHRTATSRSARSGSSTP